MKKSILAIAAMLCGYCSNLQAQNADYYFATQLNKCENRNVDRAFVAISNSDKYFIVIVPAGLIATGLLHNNAEMKSAGVQSAIALGISTIFSTAMKNSIKRERPFVEHTDIVKRSDGGGYSFPSGHTSSAFAIATSVSLSYRKWYVVVPAYTYASLVGVSRVVLGVHYPSDVICGAVVGTTSAFAAQYLNRKLFAKSSRKKIAI
jgi:membrane-associated phospholipid phosphatase